VSTRGLTKRLDRLEAAAVRALDDAIEYELRRLGIDPDAPLSAWVAAGAVTAEEAECLRRCGAWPRGLSPG
jgi:hypothetical protein